MAKLARMWCVACPRRTTAAELGVELQRAQSAQIDP
jgi:hypothetical protein